MTWWMWGLTIWFGGGTLFIFLLGPALRRNSEISPEEYEEEIQIGLENLHLQKPAEFLPVAHA